MPKSEPKNPTNVPGGNQAPGNPTAQCPKKLTITSETYAKQPSDRARARIGVGKKVKLTATPGPANWSYTGRGQLSGTVGDTVDYVAPERGEKVEITATSGGCSGSLTLTVVEPSDVFMEPQSDARLHTPGTPSTGALMNIWIRPADVSFQNIQVREQEVRAVGTEYFQDSKPLHHPKEGWSSIVSVEANGSRVEAPDTARAAASKPGKGNSGTLTWSIPWEYQLPADILATAIQFKIVDQVFTMNKDGSSTLTKAHATVDSPFW